jgi:hemerythrin
VLFHCIIFINEFNGTLLGDLMALMTWDSTLSVGVKEIDTQHQKLVELINKLHDGMSSGKSHEVMGDILQELAKYTVYHFGAEEKYMQKFAYPEYPAHKKEHDALLKQVTDFKTQFDSGKKGISMELMDFLKKWLLNHIKGTDKKYTKFFNDHGLK